MLLQVVVVALLVKFQAPTRNRLGVRGLLPREVVRYLNVSEGREEADEMIGCCGRRRRCGTLGWRHGSRWWTWGHRCIVVGPRGDVWNRFTCG